MTYTKGDALPQRTFGPITRTDIVRYQGASGDFNPIHHDEEFAKSAGFPTVFSVGMLQAGYLASYVTDLLGPANVRNFRVRFSEQVWPGDVLTCDGTVSDITTDSASGEQRATLELRVTRQTGGTAIQGWATFALPE
jgi:acyl dehydratase